jgi:hypothetical protein
MQAKCGSTAAINSADGSSTVLWQKWQLSTGLHCITFQEGECSSSLPWKSHNETSCFLWSTNWISKHFMEKHFILHLHETPWPFSISSHSQIDHIKMFST